MLSFRSVLAGVAITAAAVSFNSAANAHFQLDATPILQNLNLSDTAEVTANTIFTGSSSGYVINITADVDVSTANGLAAINSIDDAITLLTFTPVIGTAFDTFSFRGQLNTNADQNIRVTVTDQHDDVFNFFITSNGNFAAIGIETVPLSGETIKKVTIEGLGLGFANIKQIGFGAAPIAPAVPEPTTWAMMLIGFAGVGFIAYRRRSRGPLLRVC
ncbi:PEPxxWA-CTERM sorting domain-containing protein [Bradyrhizobium sp. sBnM-33]|nr:PEPxxWA-CTERM sorting domain-containing protein [Bradyrhizobium sp. sBnM-33]WOH53753.1 PEPxxWA-CTERM sorting domain-containing protein [Bradyrhizobium sp. sBnM-33]